MSTPDEKTQAIEAAVESLEKRKKELQSCAFLSPEQHMELALVLGCIQDGKAMLEGK